MILADVNCVKATWPHEIKSDFILCLRLSCLNETNARPNKLAKDPFKLKVKD